MKPTSQTRFWLVLALVSSLFALDAFAADSGRSIRYNDARVTEVTNGLLTYLEGSFGALLMAAAGIFAVMAAAIGQYRAALALLVVAIGAFILRSFMATFFNDTAITGGGGPAVSTVSGRGALTDGAGSVRVIERSNVILATGGLGTPVVAWKEGEITFAGPTDALGRVVIIRHARGITSVYGHLDAITVAQNDKVLESQQIGTVGTSGLRDGAPPQLHFEIRVDNQRIPAHRGVRDLQLDGGGVATNPELFVGDILTIPTAGLPPGGGNPEDDPDIQAVLQGSAGGSAPSRPRGSTPRDLRKEELIKF